MTTGAGWKRGTKTAIRRDWISIETVTFALAIGTISAAESVGTASNGTTEPHGHGGRPIDTAGAKFFLSANSGGEYPTKWIRNARGESVLVSRSSPSEVSRA